MNGKDKITNMNNMEIKVGDKVRVSKDAPKLIFGSCDMSQIVCTVCCVDKDVAAINVKNDERIELKVWIVPLKYLVKVDAEKKEPEYKYQVGQKVKSAYANEILTIKERCGRVRHDNVYKVEEYAYTWNECELQPCTEPTEAEKKSNVGSIKIPVEVDLTDSYWDAYAADLAKEIAVKVANKYTDPKETAEYAVKVAKAVVEGLKRK